MKWPISNEEQKKTGSIIKWKIIQNLAAECQWIIDYDVAIETLVKIHLTHSKNQTKTTFMTKLLP